jgi:hypothetical protein
MISSPEMMYLAIAKQDLVENQFEILNLLFFKHFPMCTHQPQLQFLSYIINRHSNDAFKYFYSNYVNYFSLFYSVNYSNSVKLLTANESHTSTSLILFDCMRFFFQ